MSEKVLQIKKTTIGKGKPKVIIPLVGKTKNKIFEEAEHAKSLQPEAIEWRVDAFKEFGDPDAVKEVIAYLHSLSTDKLLLFTFRSKQEGGYKEISKEDYVAINKTAIETHQIDLVDVELFAGETEVREIVAAAKANGVYVVMSNHDFQKTPNKDEIVARLRKMQEYGADIPKIAVMPQQETDVLTLLEATAEMKKNYADRPIFTMSMGGLGVISRISGEIFGSSMTFGSGDQASAPGQIPVDSLKKALDIVHSGLAK